MKQKLTISDKLEEILGIKNPLDSLTSHEIRGIFEVLYKQYENAERVNALRRFEFLDQKAWYYRMLPWYISMYAMLTFLLLSFSFLFFGLQSNYIEFRFTSFILISISIWLFLVMKNGRNDPKYAAYFWYASITLVCVFGFLLNLIFLTFVFMCVVIFAFQLIVGKDFAPPSRDAYIASGILLVSMAIIVISMSYFIILPYSLVESNYIVFLEYHIHFLTPGIGIVLGLILWFKRYVPPKINPMQIELKGSQEYIKRLYIKEIMKLIRRSTTYQLATIMFSDQMFPKPFKISNVIIALYLYTFFFITFTCQYFSNIFGGFLSPFALIVYISIIITAFLLYITYTRWKNSFRARILAWAVIVILVIFLSTFFDDAYMSMLWNSAILFLCMSVDSENNRTWILIHPKYTFSFAAILFIAILAVAYALDELVHVGLIPMLNGVQAITWFGVTFFTINSLVCASYFLVILIKIRLTGHSQEKIFIHKLLEIYPNVRLSFF
ncbi:MAG: hypothetical protein QXT63_06955 [Thermoplasmata archaeon]